MIMSLLTKGQPQK